jgi:formate-dependent nitrite reductase membrane component NrfD
MPELPSLERWTATLGHLARPYVLTSASTGSMIATISIPFTGADLFAGAAFIAAAWAGVAALYAAKAVEERDKARSTADIAIARASGTSSTPQQVVVTNTAEDPVQVEETTP